MTAKDPVSMLEPKSGPAKAVRHDAVGAEIPVTVHASRTTQGLGKNLPAVHEDTKTVIVLPQGAVVRLTANLVTGETVVLTNRMTGADVLCRVGKIKSQPGIQHYVDLEFLQRAPSFWGDALAAITAPAVEAPAPRTPAPVAVVPPAPARGPVAASAPPLQPVAAAPPAPEPVAPPVLAASAPPPAPGPAPVVALPPPAAVAETIETAPVADPSAPSWKQSPPAPVTPIRGGLSEPSFGGFSNEVAASNPPGSRKVLMVAAAVLLLLAAGAGGYWFNSHQSASASPASGLATQPVAPPQVIPDLTAVSTPASDLTPPAPATPPAEAQLRTDAMVEPRTSVEPPANRLPPASITTAPAPPRPLRRNNVPIGELKAPKAKTTVARMDSSVPPPAIAGALNLSDAGAASALLASEPAGPAPPSTVGGQLQQPQLISSTAPVYPPNARMQRIQGTVVLDALVDETGKVVETTVIGGPQPLRVAAQDALRNWKYKPAQLNGKPIAVHTRVSLRFALQ